MYATYSMLPYAFGLFWTLYVDYLPLHLRTVFFGFFSRPLSFFVGYLLMKLNFYLDAEICIAEVVESISCAGYGRTKKKN